MRTAVIAVAALVACGAARGSFPGADGRVVFQRAGSGDPEPTLVAVDPATGAQQVLGAGAEPAFSPDGSKLAFVRNHVVYVSSPDGSGAVAEGAGDFPAWSPDGGKLVVSRVRADGVFELYVVDLADGSSSQLTDLPFNATMPAWAPNGATIAFVTPTGLATVDPSSGIPAAVAIPGVTIDGGPSWSPDGRSLAFMDSGGQVWVSSADGSGGHQVTHTLFTPTGSTPAPARPAWSPDGASIAFTAGADLCVTDVSGIVRRVTRTQQPSAAVLGSLPDWQPIAGGRGTIFAAPPGANDSTGCDWNPGVRVELLDANVSPSILTFAAPKELVFVNHLTRAVTVRTTLHNAYAKIEPGRFFGFATQPGTYDFTVTGYADGVPRHGTFVATAAGHVTAEAHAPLAYGSQTDLQGSAGPGAGTVTITAKAFGSSRVTRVGTVTPTRGRWRVTVAPKISTTYEVAYNGATAERLLRVMPVLRVSRNGGTVGVSVKPARPLVRSSVFLFRLRGAGWDEYRSTRLGPTAASAFRNVPAGRYYVAFSGGDAYWSTATDPFTVGR